jgi:O-antigen ligase
MVQLVFGRSADSSATVQECTQWFSIACLFAVSSSTLKPFTERRRFLQLFVILAGLIAAFAIVQPYAGQFGLEGLAAAADERVGPFTSRNAYASFVLLGFPVAVWSARRLGPEWWLPAGALLASSLTTGSRAGAALTLAEAVVLCFWMRSRVWVAAFGVMAMAGFFLGGENLRVRLGYADPLEHRRDIYASSLELISARPFTGWGLGTFQSVYPAQARFDVGAVVNHAHSDWLEAAVEGGLIYAVAVLGCALLMLWPARATIWALGLPMVLLHSLVDFPFQRPGVIVWFVLLAAAAQYREPARARMAAASG